MKKSDRAKMGRRNRAKGAAFEREVAKALNEVLPPGYHARRRLQNRGGLHEPDVGVFRQDSPIPLWHIECKTGKAPSLPAAVRQALAQRANTAMVAIAIRRYRGRPECYMVCDNAHVRGEYTLRRLAVEIAESLRDPIMDGLPEEVPA